MHLSDGCYWRTLHRFAGRLSPSLSMRSKAIVRLRSRFDTQLESLGQKNLLTKNAVLSNPQLALLMIARQTRCILSGPRMPAFPLFETRFYTSKTLPTKWFVNCSALSISLLTLLIHSLLISKNCWSVPCSRTHSFAVLGDHSCSTNCLLKGTTDFTNHSCHAGARLQ
jgi:hypothetical protein